jgi:uncharacterized surface protein with fasciclin (FAS1) repeats
MKAFVLLAAVFAQTHPAPQTALDVVAASKDHTTLAKLATSLPAVVDVLKSAGPLTLFAPTDAAFAQLPQATLDAVSKNQTLLASILSYHVLAGTAFAPTANTPAREVVKTATGESLRVDVAAGPKVSLAFGLGTSDVTGSVPTSNGIVHVVNKVLVPPAAASQTAVDAKLNRLVAALQKVNLVSTVDGLKDVTIFAPLDAAFEALDKFAASANLTVTDDLLATVLKTHIIPSVVYSTDIVKAKSIPSVETVSKAPLSVKFEGNSVLINGAGNTNPAKVVIADVLIKGGVVHVIDTVLLPKLDAPASSNTQPKPIASSAMVAAPLALLSLAATMLF